MLRASLLVLLLAGSTAAKDSIATVTAAKSISVNGIAMNTEGIPAVPLVSGDSVSTVAEPAILTLKDGSVFKLDQNSSVRVSDCGVTDVEVLQGTVTYKFSASSKAQLCALGHPVTSKALVEGSIAIQSPQEAILRTADLHNVSLPSGQCRCDLPKTRKKIPTTILVLGIAGVAAAGIAAGLALTLPGSVSPTGQ